MSDAPLPAPYPTAAPPTHAATAAAARRSLESVALARRISALVAERRGTDVVLLDVRSLVDYTDFFLIASGTSGRQNQAIAEHVVRTLKQDRLLAISKSGLDTGSWICLDLGDVVVHVFDPETRARYDLELLWADAPLVDVVEKPAPGDAAPAADEGEDADADAAPRATRRRRPVRKAAVEDADAENAPDSERPPPDEPEPESKPSGPAGAAKKRRAPAPKPSPVAKKRPPAKAPPKRKRKPAD